MKGSWPSGVALDPGVGGLGCSEGSSPLAGEEGEPRRKKRNNDDNNVL